MKPLPILLFVNFAFFAIWAIVFTVVANRPEYIPLFFAFQAAVNLLGAGIFLLDQKKKIVVAFVISAVMCGILSGAGFYFLDKYQHLIRMEENQTV